MEVIIVVASMLIIAAIVWLLNRILPFTLCPVCAAVSGTWLLIQLALVLRLLAGQEWLWLTALLMGGTVVGVAYQGERSVRWAGSHPLLWKVLVVSGGIPLMYAMLQKINWWSIVLEVVALGVMTYF